MPLLLYHACLDSFSKFKTSPVSEEPLFHAGIFLMDVGNIACNLFLFRYLENKRENNTGKMSFVTNKTFISSNCSAQCNRHEKGKNEKSCSCKAQSPWNVHYGFQYDLDDRVPGI